MKHAIIAMITDFGTEDGYVGAMKGRIKGAMPGVDVIDISHEIDPYNIRQGAFCLHNSYPFFPDKTVFMVVVDPGVGTHRRGIVLKSSQHWFVGPDNGVFSFVYQREGVQVFEINLDAVADHIAPTFHGRDVFAPVAARLAAGESMGDLLRPAGDPVSFLSEPRRLSEREFALEILHVDHFGNLILNFHRSDWETLDHAADFTIQLKGVHLTGLRETFGEADQGELLLTWDSTGYLQIAVNRGQAARRLGSVAGDEARLCL